MGHAVAHSYLLVRVTDGQLMLFFTLSYYVPTLRQISMTHQKKKEIKSEVVHDD